MRSGHAGRKKQRFHEAFAAVQKDLATWKLEHAVMRLRKIEQEGLFPPERQWEYAQLVGQTLFLRADMKAAMPYLRLAWEAPHEDPAARLGEFSSWLMFLHYSEDISDEKLRDAHLLYNEMIGTVPRFSHEKREREKLRIGYLSPNMQSHVVMNFVIQLFFAYDRARFEVFLYDVGTQHNEVTDWVSSMTDGYTNISGLSSRAAAERIHRDGIDILFDLAGHSEQGKTLRIMAYKPAPIQISGIGYFNTTGLSAVDYFLGDPICDPPSMDALFSERILRLPKTHLCFTPTEHFRPYEQLSRTPHETIVFGSFNNFAKITDEMLRLWREILAAVPDAHLLLKNVFPMEEPLAWMRERAISAGIDPARMELRPGSKDYLRDYLDVDIILDTHPYPGGGTTCEALLMGLPVVTIAGTRHGARFGASLLQNAGLAELVADSPEGYAERAVLLARDTELLRSLHIAIPRMMRSSPLMDGSDYVRCMEAAYERIWERYLYEETQEKSF